MPDTTLHFRVLEIIRDSGGALLALVLGTLAWFTLFRPAVENIAEDAASDAAAVNRAVIDEKLAEVEEAAAEAAELPLGQPVDLRVAVSPGVGATGIDAVPVGMGRTVSVTDVVFPITVTRS